MSNTIEIQNRPPKLLTVRETARTGIMTESALRRWVKEGKVPHVAVGNRILINYDKLVEQIQEA